jgi:hypothetical protein
MIVGGGVATTEAGQEVAEVLMSVEECDMETGIEEAGGEVEHAVDVALERPREHRYVRRRARLPWVQLDRVQSSSLLFETQRL